MELKAGQRLRSAVSAVEIVVVRAPAFDVALECGGVPFVAPGSEMPDAVDATEDGPLLGKRYADEELGLEVLVTKAGHGALTVNGAPLAPKDAKSLPSSD